MTHIHDLPFEIMSEIFRFCMQPHEDKSIHPLSTFPHNAATTCTFWLDVLKSMPNCWKRLHFDLADDHYHHLLNTLRLPSDEPREVPLNALIVMTQEHLDFSLDALERGDQINLENRRARAVFDRLLPHIAKYATIHFDVHYQSSLPSCADILRLHLPHLTQLVFRCQVYDLDDREPKLSCESPPLLRTDGDSHDITPYKLNGVMLSIPGLSFIELAQLGEEWIAQFFLPAHPLLMEISHFKFRTHAAVNAFLDLFAMRGGRDHTILVLRHLSVADGFDLSSEAQHKVINRPANATNKLRFEGVSQEVISFVLSSVRFPLLRFERSSLSQISFDDCIIPPIPEVARIRRVDHLHVRPCREPRDAEAQLIGLKGAISAFAPRNVFLSDFLLTEEFVDWLRGGCGVEGSMSVSMQNCTLPNGELVVRYMV